MGKRDDWWPEELSELPDDLTEHRNLLRFLNRERKKSKSGGTISCSVSDLKSLELSTIHFHQRRKIQKNIIARS